MSGSICIADPPHHVSGDAVKEMYGKDICKENMHVQACAHVSMHVRNYVQVHSHMCACTCVL